MYQSIHLLQYMVFLNYISNRIFLRQYNSVFLLFLMQKNQLIVIHVHLYVQKINVIVENN